MTSRMFVPEVLMMAGGTTVSVATLAGGRAGNVRHEHFIVASIGELDVSQVKIGIGSVRQDRVLKEPLVRERCCTHRQRAEGDSVSDLGDLVSRLRGDDRLRL